VEIPTPITVADGDASLSSFAEALKARGVNAEPWQIEQFRDLKDAGYSAARIISETSQRATIVKSRLLKHSALLGATTGAVAFPLLDLIKKGSESWRKILSKSPKSSATGAVIGSVAALGYEKLVVEAHNDAAQAALRSFTAAVPDMEIAWAQTMAKRAAQELPAVPAKNTDIVR
jgi:hypothetical protein